MNQYEVSKEALLNEKKVSKEFIEHELKGE